MDAEILVWKLFSCQPLLSEYQNLGRGEVYVWLLLDVVMLRLASSQMPKFTQFFLKCGGLFVKNPDAFFNVTFVGAFLVFGKETVGFDVFIVCPSVRPSAWNNSVRIGRVFVLGCVIGILSRKF